MVLAGRVLLVRGLPAVTVVSAAPVVKVDVRLEAVRAVSVVLQSKMPSLRAKSPPVTSQRTQPDRFDRCIKALRDGRKTVPFCFWVLLCLALPSHQFR